MNQLYHLCDAIIAAENELRRLREERSSLLVRICGRKVGDDFEQGSMRYKVYSISASANGDSVWLSCRYWTTGKKWSTGTKAVNIKVEG